MTLSVVYTSIVVIMMSSSVTVPDGIVARSVRAGCIGSPKIPGVLT